jgi:hypothetical protein
VTDSDVITILTCYPNGLTFPLPNRQPFTWWMSRKKWPIFSGRVSNGTWPRMTIRSKQWYTKASGLPNSFAKVSLGSFL